MTAELSKLADETLRALTGMPGTSGIVSRDLVQHVVGDPGRADDVIAEWKEAGFARDLDDQQHIELTAIMQPASESLPGYRTLIEWYTIRAGMADNITQPHSWRLFLTDTTAGQLYESAEHATSWFREHHHRLLFMLEAALAQGWHDLALQLAESMWSLYRFTGDHAGELSTQTYCQAAADHLPKDQQPLHRAMIYGRTAYALTSLHCHDDALDHAEHALDHARQADDPRILSTCLSIHGRALHAAEQPRAALESYQHALVLAEELDDPRSVALQHRRIGEALMDLDDNAAALRHLETAADLMGTAGDTVGRARVTTFLGRALLTSGQPQRAYDAVHSTLLTLERSGCDLWLAEAQEVIGQAAEHTDPTGVDALLHYTVALARFEASGEPVRMERVRTLIDAVTDRQVQ